MQPSGLVDLSCCCTTIQLGLLLALTSYPEGTFSSLQQAAQMVNQGLISTSKIRNTRHARIHLQPRSTGAALLTKHLRNSLL